MNMKHTTFKIRNIAKDKEPFQQEQNNLHPNFKTFQEKPFVEYFDSLRSSVLQLIKISQAPAVEARDRMVTVGVQKMEDKEGIFEGSQKWADVESWMGQVCSQVLSSGFHMHISGQMSYEQAKAYCCQGVLRNIARFVEVNQVSPRFYQSIDRLLRDKVLPYFGLKYPPSSSSGVNKRLNRLFKEVNNSEVLTNDFFYNNNDIEFEYRESGEYNDLIMRVLNRVIAVADLPAREEEGSTNFEFFEEFMGDLFEKVYDEQWMAGKEGKEEGETEKNEKDSAYREKVKEYTHFLIGRKIPLSVSEYSEEEIKSGFVSIKSPTVLRIITKWCEELWEKFENENYFIDRTEGLLMIKGKQINTVYLQLKQTLKKQLRQQKIIIEQYTKNIGKNNYQMQSSIIKMEKETKHTQFIKKDERIFGGFSAKIVKNLQNYIIVYLNRLIHGLMKVSKNVYNSRMLIDTNWPNPPNLLSFKVGDLLRCKCASKEREIVKIFQEMQRISEKTPEVMRIIRVKNRLSLGTNDVLINVRFNNCVTTEVQLKVETGSVDSKFSQCSYNFSHLIYELQRAQFGPISEMCSIWMNLDPKAKLYSKLTVSDKMSTDTIERESLCKEHTLEVAQNSPFICTSCCQAYSNNNYVVPHLKCSECHYWKCAICFIKEKESQDLIQVILEEDVRSKCRPLRCTELPKYFVGVFIESKLKEVNFYMVISLDKKYLLKVREDTLQFVKELSTQKKMKQFLNSYLVFEIIENVKDSFFPKANYQLIIRDQIFKTYVKKCYKNQKQTISLNNLKYEEGRYLTGHDFSQILSGTSEQKKSVKYLQLAMNNLDNSQFISPGEFTNLQFLNINTNKIGSLLNLTQFSRLNSIFAHSNSLSSIPAGFCRMKLKFLILSYNKISQFPAEIGNIQTLQVLRFNNNLISILPQSFRNLQNLKEITATNNLISSIEEIVSPKMQILIMNFNKITIIPPIFERLVNLFTFDLSYNKITAIQAQFSKLKRLRIINLQNNPLMPFPITLNGATPSKIDMRYMVFNHIPKGLTLPNLKQINLSSGSLGKIDSMKIFENAEKLILTGNLLQQLPDDISLLKKLKHLSLASNKLFVLPPTLFDLRLIFLDISSNSFTQLQSEFSRMKTLTTLILAGNKIKSLPAYLSNMHNLYFINITSNPIVLVPEQMIGMKKLKSFQFANTKITQMPIIGLAMQNDYSDYHLQSLPSVMPRLEIVQSLILDFNNLQIIPNSISQMVNLRKLSVTHNKLTSIGEGIFQLQHLTQLIISYNQLKEIGDKYERLAKLKNLNISSNKLKVIPNSICQLLKPGFTILFQDNPLEFIPQSLLIFLMIVKPDTVQLKNMKIKDLPLIPNPESIKQIILSDNKFDKFPESLTQYRNVQKLDISSNNILTFFSSMKNLSKLRVLDLTDNNIEQIPQQFSQLKKLKQLNLCGNPLKKLHPDLASVELDKLLFDVKCMHELSQSQSLSYIHAKAIVFQNDAIQNIPQSIEELQNVHEITFQNLQITTLPETIAKLCQLQKLSVLECSMFQELPNGIGSMSGLLQLSVNYCKLQTLPTSITKLTGLQKLNLNSNKIKKLPNDMGALKSLVQLNVYNNNLTALPVSITSLTQLQILNIRQNKIEALPVGLSNCILLKQINASENKIQLILKQISKLNNIKKGSLNLGLNPIKRIDCIDFIKEKGDAITIKIANNCSVQTDKLETL